MKNLSIEIHRGPRPENCKTARMDAIIECAEGEPDMIKFYDTQDDRPRPHFPKIGTPNSTLMGETRELLTQFAPGFDIETLNHNISDTDYRNITKVEEMLAKIDRSILPVSFFVLPIITYLAFATTEHDSSLSLVGDTQAESIILAKMFAPYIMAGFAIQPFINWLYDRAQLKTEKQISRDLQEFIRCENINLDY